MKRPGVVEVYKRMADIAIEGMDTAISPERWMEIIRKDKYGPIVADAYGKDLLGATTEEVEGFIRKRVEEVEHAGL